MFLFLLGRIGPERSAKQLASSLVFIVSQYLISPGCSGMTEINNN